MCSADWKFIWDCIRIFSLQFNKYRNVVKSLCNDNIAVIFSVNISIQMGWPWFTFTSPLCENYGLFLYRIAVAVLEHLLPDQIRQIITIHDFKWMCLQHKTELLFDSCWTWHMPPFPIVSWWNGKGFSVIDAKASNRSTALLFLS